MHGHKRVDLRKGSRSYHLGVRIRKPQMNRLYGTKSTCQVSEAGALPEIEWFSALSRDTRTCKKLATCAQTRQTNLTGRIAIALRATDRAQTVENAPIAAPSGGIDQLSSYCLSQSDQQSKDGTIRVTFLGTPLALLADLLARARPSLNQRADSGAGPQAGTLPAARSPRASWLRVRWRLRPSGGRTPWPRLRPARAGPAPHPNRR